MSVGSLSIACLALLSTEKKFVLTIECQWGRNVLCSQLEITCNVKRQGVCVDKGGFASICLVTLPFKSFELIYISAFFPFLKIELTTQREKYCLFCVQLLAVSVCLFGFAVW